MTNPTYKFTTWAEIEYLYSTSGSGLVTDDLTGADLAAWKLWVEYTSTEEVMLYLGTRYNDPYELSTSNIVRIWATTLGAYTVSRRRGNPALFQNMRDEAIENMKKTQAGELSLPFVASNKSDVPSMHNYTIDSRHIVNPIRNTEDGVSYSNTPNDKPRVPGLPMQ